MPKFSITYQGIVLMLAMWAVDKFQLTIAPEALQTTVETVIVIVGGLLAFYGRFRKGGVNLIGVRTH